MLNTELRKSVATFGKSWVSVVLPTNQAVVSLGMCLGGSVAVQYFMR